MYNVAAVAAEHGGDVRVQDLGRDGDDIRLRNVGGLNLEEFCYILVRRGKLKTLKS